MGSKVEVPLYSMLANCEDDLEIMRAWDRLEDYDEDEDDDGNGDGETKANGEDALGKTRVLGIGLGMDVTKASCEDDLKRRARDSPEDGNDETNRD